MSIAPLPYHFVSPYWLVCMLPRFPPFVCAAIVHFRRMAVEEISPSEDESVSSLWGVGYSFLLAQVSPLYH
uniref:Uncharacterized protein n=1 Tax=Picea sitchensis TaxID=3332 RepID=A0A6B9XS04_PICSI|nr:hypothetical protein Q903MT_gene3770 [Picea sitchensis]